MGYWPTPCETCAALREENERLRWVVKGAHGALTDAATVVVPGALDGDLKPAIRQLTRERDEAREENERLRADLSRTLAEVERPFRQRIEELERTHQILVNKAVGGMDLGRYEKYTIIRTDKLTELERQRDAALVHGPEDLIRALEAAEAKLAKAEAVLKLIAGDGCGMATKKDEPCHKIFARKDDWCWCCIAGQYLAAAKRGE